MNFNQKVKKNLIDYILIYRDHTLPEGEQINIMMNPNLEGKFDKIAILSLNTILYCLKEIYEDVKKGKYNWKKEQYNELVKSIVNDLTTTCFKT